MHKFRWAATATAIALAAGLIAVVAVAGAPAVDSGATRYQYDVRMLEHDFLLTEKSVDEERELLNRMAADSWELVQVATYPPAQVPAGVGRMSKDRLTRTFYFRRPIR